MPRLICPCWASALSLVDSFSNMAGFLAMRTAGVLGAQLFANKATDTERTAKMICFFIVHYYKQILAQRK